MEEDKVSQLQLRNLLVSNYFQTKKELWFNNYGKKINSSGSKSMTTAKGDKLWSTVVHNTAKIIKSCRPCSKKRCEMNRTRCECHAAAFKSYCIIYGNTYSLDKNIIDIIRKLRKGVKQHQIDILVPIKWLLLGSR
jgi:hypothetical protein